MILALVFPVIVALTARGSNAAECLEPASRIVSRWKNGNYYKGEVESITNRINVLFDNGARLAYSPRDNVDIVVDRIPDHTELPWGNQILVNRPRSRAFEIGYIRDIRNGRYAVLYENGDTIYHTRDDIRAFNKSLICDEPAYLGCYRDNLPRSLEVYIPIRPATIGACVDGCKSQGFSIGALRNSDLCFCGNSYNKTYQVADKECDMSCYDNSFEICGGFMTFSQYWTGIVDTKLGPRPGMQKHFIPSNSPIPWELLMHSRSKYPSRATSGAVQSGAWYRTHPWRVSQWQTQQQGTTGVLPYQQQAQSGVTSYASPYQTKPSYSTTPYQSYQQYGAQTGTPNNNRYQLQGQPPSYNYQTAGATSSQPANYGAYQKQTTRWPYAYNYKYNNYRKYNYKTGAANSPPNNGYKGVYQRRPAARPSPQEHAKLMALLKKVNWGLYKGITQASTLAPKAFRYLGCFQDSEARDLQTAVDVKPLTIESCVAKCRQSGFSVAGVQLSTHCYCGTTYSKYGRLRNDRCTMRCAGNYHEICGGAMMNSLFYTGVGQAVPYMEKYGARKQPLTFNKNIAQQYHPKTKLKLTQLMARKRPQVIKTATTQKTKPKVTNSRYGTSKLQPKNAKNPISLSRKLNKFKPIQDYGQLKNILLMLSKWKQQPHKTTKNKTVNHKTMPSYSELKKILQDMTPDIVKKIANKIIAADSHKAKLSAMKPLSAMKSLEVNLASIKPTVKLDTGFKRLNVKTSGLKDWSKKVNNKGNLELNTKARKPEKSAVKTDSSANVLLEADAEKLNSSASSVVNQPFTVSTAVQDGIALATRTGTDESKVQQSSMRIAKGNSSTSESQGSMRYADQRVSEVREENGNTVHGLPSFIPIADKEKKQKVRNKSSVKSSHSLHRKQDASKRRPTPSKNFVMSDVQSNKRNFVHFVITSNDAKKSEIPTVTAPLSRNITYRNETRDEGSRPKSRAKSTKSRNVTRSEAKQMVQLTTLKESTPNVTVTTEVDETYGMPSNETYGMPSNETRVKQNMKGIKEVKQPLVHDVVAHKMDPKHVVHHVATHKMDPKNVVHHVETHKMDLNNIVHKAVTHKMDPKHIIYDVVAHKMDPKHVIQDVVAHKMDPKHRKVPHKVLHVEAKWNGQINVKANWKDEVEPKEKAKKSKVKLPKKAAKKSKASSDGENGTENDRFDDSGSRNELVWNRSRTHSELLHKK